MRPVALNARRSPFRPGAATVSSDEIVHHLLATDPEVKEALVARFGADRIRTEVLLRDFTTFRTGGPAQWLLETRGSDEIVDALRIAEFMDVLPKQYDLNAFFGAVLKAVRAIGSLWQTP